ncbi:MAG: hypothetical protein PHI37_01940, partial [Candidatus Gracilibacteria bacterium]|nr:hypothetical protein [Candidatus Gracilibacteria bacterium]
TIKILGVPTLITTDPSITELQTITEQKRRSLFSINNKTNLPGNIIEKINTGILGEGFVVTAEEIYENGAIQNTDVNGGETSLLLYEGTIEDLSNETIKTKVGENIISYYTGVESTLGNLYQDIASSDGEVVLDALISNRQGGLNSKDIALNGNTNNGGSSSGGGSTPIDGLCGSDNGGNFTSNPTNLCNGGTASSVTDNGGGSTYDWTCEGINGGITVSCNANNINASQYPGCNELDITIGSYTVAACNVGATIASTDWTVSRGSYFQFGRNKGFPYSESLRTSSQINGDIGLNPLIDTYYFIGYSGIPNGDWANTDITNNWGHTTNTSISRQGPCANGYHVPSQEEWAGIRTEGGWGNNGTIMQNSIKLPYAGSRVVSDGSYANGGSFGFYWSSSIIPGVGYSSLMFNSGFISSAQPYSSATGMQVRCFKN